MSQPVTHIVPCPECRKPTPWSTENQWRPFCSERCRLIDLGAWANEDHVIAGDSILDSSSSPDEYDDT